MKRFYIHVGISLLVLFISPASIFAQLTNGGINAGFGVDGDTRNNFVKYGPVNGNIISDDWFASSGQNIIDTANASTYFSLLQSGVNMGFSQRMSVPLYSRINGKLWLDAVYGRDFIATSPLFDSTAFTSSDKNGDDPANWNGGTTNLPDKDDLLDVYAHMRRDGTTGYDSLWLFTGVSTVGTSGSRYFDAELYKNNFSYNSITGKFTSAGTSAGHTEWKFDASGNITQTGDMILAVNFTPGAPPVVDLRIWVSSTTYTTVVPARFNFGAAFNGSTAAYGYASIISKAGTTAFGSGISNYSATPANDTTYSTPWGTEQSTKNWGTQYQTLQLVEIGLNLTRIGLDPALYTAQGMTPCTSLFSDIFFKSRASNSFVSNMHDFVSPLQFVSPPIMDFSVTPDTLRCNKATGMIQLANNSTIGVYTWQTTNGNIVSTNSDGSQMSLNKPGKYIVSASPLSDCPATRVDTIVIPIDTFPPVATAFATVGSNYSYLQLIGGDVAASNYMTPFGGSQGLLWDWSGPNAFTSTTQNPILDTTWGTYQLIVTEKRNGCKDTAQETLSFNQFIVLAENTMTLTGKYTGQSTLLTWQDKNSAAVDFYTIEKSTDGIHYMQIGTVANSNLQGASGIETFSFTDNNAGLGENIYRVKSVGIDGKITYSNLVMVNADPTKQHKIYLSNNYGGKQLSLVCNSENNARGTVVVYNVLGQPLEVITTQLNTGINIIDIPINNTMSNSVIVVSLFKNDQLTFSQKAAL
jgi:hypothetical protein